MGNPIRELEYQNNRIDQYKRYDLCVTHLCSQYSTRGSEITRRFPTLEILDQEPVAKISFDAPPTSHASTTGFVQHPSATTFPAEMMPPFITGVDGSVISGFLMRYVVSRPVSLRSWKLTTPVQLLPLIRHPTVGACQCIPPLCDILLLCQHLDTCASKNNQIARCEAAQVGLVALYQ